MIGVCSSRLSGLNIAGMRPITPGVVMPRFRFSLEAVRELREQAESSAKEDLARELAAAHACDQELAAAGRRLAAARAPLALVPNEPVDAGALKARQDYVARRELEQAVAALNANDQADRVDAGRKVLELAAQEREAVERTKRRRAREHAAAIERAELRLLEDLGLRNHGNPSRPDAA
ncbi:MAG TPA: hypothetical protein VFB25_09135 [Gaiellaceae bacterium]|nr:hypothetical protein [Gaiellaceae bacterium]